MSSQRKVRSIHQAFVALHDDLFGLLLLQLLLQRVRWVTSRIDEFREKADVADGKSQRVDLGEALLVRQRRNVRPEPVERVVDGLHSTALAHIGRLPLMGGLLGHTAAVLRAAAPLARPPRPAALVVLLVRRALQQSHTTQALQVLQKSPAQVELVHVVALAPLPRLLSCFARGFLGFFL